MKLPCETCLVLARCKQLVCPNPPRFVSSTTIVDNLLTHKLERSIKCPELRIYCGAGNAPRSDGIEIWRNIYNITNFFSKPYGESYL